jgi:hypothetical protein
MQFFSIIDINVNVTIRWEFSTNWLIGPAVYGKRIARIPGTKV